MYMKQFSRTKLWWPGIEKDIEQKCETSYACSLVTRSTEAKPLVCTKL